MFHLIGRLAYYAAIGLVSLVAIGPVVAVAGALLPFALIGLPVYAGYRGVRRLVRGRKAELEPAGQPGEDARAEVAAVVVKEEPAQCERPVRRGRVVVEMLCGGLVGGLVAAAMGWQMPELATTVVPAVVAGVVVGYVVGGSAPHRAASPTCAPDARA